MAEPTIRINKVLRELNLSLERAIDYLKYKGITINPNPNIKISQDVYEVLYGRFAADKKINEASKEFGKVNRKEKEILRKSPNKSDNKLKKSEVSLKKDNLVRNSVPKIEINSHRDFRVLDQKETSTILKDCLTHKTYACKKISKLIGEYVKMQVVSLEDPDKPKFKYSVLNDFEINKEYEFDIVEKIETGYLIENSEDFKAFIPLSYENSIINGKKIKLKVYEINEQKNKLIFKPKEENNRTISKVIGSFQKISPKDVFKVDEKYDFNITGFKTINDSLSIILIEYKGIETSVKAFDFQNDNNTSGILTCLVTDIIDDKVKLMQDRYSLFSNLYQVNNFYSFKVCSKEIDLKSNTAYYLLEDKFGFYHKLYPNQYNNIGFDAIINSVEVNLYLRKIDEKGFLILYVDNVNNQGHFVSVESVFLSINQFENINKYFYGLDQYLKLIHFQEQQYSQLFNDYENKENLWVFSYLSFLEAIIQFEINNNNFLKASELNEIYFLVEEWLLEGSDFLQKFSPEKKQNIIQKAEHQRIKSIERKEALELIINNESEKFLQKVLNSLRLSGHLIANKINVFKNIIAFNKDSLNQKTSEIIEIVIHLINENLLEEYDIYNLLGLLQYRFNIESDIFNHNFLRNKSEFYNEDNQSEIDNLIKVLGLQILLLSKSNNIQKAVAKSTLMCRYLSLLTEDNEKKKLLLNYGVYLITNNKYILITPTIISSFELDYFITHFCSQEKPLYNNTSNLEFMYNSNGAIYKTPIGWAIFSKQQINPYTKKRVFNMVPLASYFDNQIIVGGINYNKQLNSDDTIQTNSNWLSYYTINDEYSGVSKQEYNDDLVGMQVNVIAKNYFKKNKNVIFLMINEPKIEGEGILHVNEVTKVKLDGLDNIINPEDELTTKIIRVDDKGISFSISEDYWTKSVEEVNIGDIIEAKVITINGGCVFLITEKGHNAFYFNTDYKHDIVERMVYKWKVENFNHEEKSLNVNFISNSSSSFNEKNSIRTFLLRNNILITHENTSFKSHGNNFPILIHELLLTIEHLLILEPDNKVKLEYFQLLKLFASISKNNKSYYYEAYLNYLNAIAKFKNLDYKVKSFHFDFIDEKTLSLFNNLEGLNDIYKYLNYYNKPDSHFDLLQDLKNENDENNHKLIKTIIAHNLLFSENPDEVALKRTKDLIYEYLSNEKINTFNFNYLDNSIQQEPLLESQIEAINDLTPLNLGKEGTYREFKTSYIYYAGSSSIDIEKQSFIIMKTIAGFLNAKGGSLFIGVNDNGDIIGLENDYKYFGKLTNNDKYEREIRSVIVKSFNKDVNSQIEFKFSKSLNHEYCEIIIPEYEKPVPLLDNFYQRQGNETRIINGNDLVLFFERKLQGSSNNDKFIFNINKQNSNSSKTLNYPSSEDSIELNLDQENPDFYTDQKSANEQLTIDYNEKTPKILAHLYIFINGKYLLSRNKLWESKGSEEIIIYDNMKKGFLLQCYDNGCVNKVEVRTLLEKTFNFPYSGAYSSEGNLIGLFLIKEDCLLQVNSSRNEIKYVKLFNTSKISTHSHLKLKGNNVIQEDYDKLESFKIIDNIHIDKLNRIIYASKQSLGVKINNTSYKDEIKYLFSI